MPSGDTDDTDNTDTLGRPRVAGEDTSEFVDLGPAPDAAEVSQRLTQLADLIVAASQATNRVPAVVISSIVHGEVIAIRPFAHGNGLVARAMERALVQALGLDPTGVAVPEAGHVANGAAGLPRALTAYGKGTAAGVGLWLDAGGGGARQAASPRASGSATRCERGGSADGPL